MGLLRKLLFPFSILYSGITAIRNRFYDLGLLKSTSYEVPVVCVGNLSVGGTGKTPMIEYLISLLRKDFRLATLSRGYKRKTRGFHLLMGNETAKEVGDEPLQFKRKFPEITVAVDEDRVHGIEMLRKMEPFPEVVLLDDAFQHRRVTAGLNILLTSYGELYSGDHVLPSGNLREPRSGAMRAQLVVVTKSPLDLDPEEKSAIRKGLKLKSGQKLFFTGISYGTMVGNSEEEIELHSLKGEEITLVTGIANPKPLVDYLEKLDLCFTHLAFPDHHNFTSREIRDLEKHSFILTTEKDYMRLKSRLVTDKLFYLPMKVSFLSSEEKEGFNGEVKAFITKK